MKDAIQELMDDHIVILRMLAVLRGMCLRLADKGTVDCADLEAALDFIKTFADYTHHGKEEDLLFPAMEAAGFSRNAGPLAVMLMEHAQGRDHVAALSRGAAALKSGAAAAAQEILRAASGYEQLLGAHIHKEDNILYPMAMNALPEGAWKTLSENFARVETERMGPQKRAAYDRLIERLTRDYPAPPAPARPAGSFCH
ncbi:MAG: hemerythrin domain-containing protein [Elusimicrobiota bacterium]